ncbi:MAG: M28 family peptidase [Candidatus Lokiarchaeota archaeon]|nr:M28 family peptidase [Candidatus Lokiarchaeota archaeon]
MKLRFRQVLIIFLIIFSLFSVILLYGWIGYATKFNNATISLKFDGEESYKHVRKQVNLGYRIPGTNDSRECVEYFISEFQEIDQNFSYFIHKFEVQSVDCQNVLFKLNEEKDNIVILGAHYDSRAKATKDPNSPDRPVPGANDGASGSAVLLELARSFYKRKSKLECELWFLFFDAEDQGKDEGGYGIKDWDWCEGSNEFVKDLEDFINFDKEDIDCMILLDMVGGKGLQFIDEQNSASSLLTEIFEIGRKLGYMNAFPTFPYVASITDDHIPFIRENIPSADLIINFEHNYEWPHHHTIYDNIDNISEKSLDITGRTIEQFIYNNYLDSYENYEGNSPWKEDIPYLNIGLLFILSIFLVGIVGIFLGYCFKRKLNALKL